MVQSKWKSVEETQEASELSTKQYQESVGTAVEEIDDHGLAILGHRIRKPIFLDDDDE